MNKTGGHDDEVSAILHAAGSVCSEWGFLYVSELDGMRERREISNENYIHNVATLSRPRQQRNGMGMQVEPSGDFGWYSEMAGTMWSDPRETNKQCWADSSSR